MDFTSGEIRGFVDAVRGKPESGECVVRGTVTRVDPDGTTWVQIGQNAEPTPCARDMACHVGDSVTVRIADHKATVTGNASAPATDDHAANEAHVAAMTAQTSAELAQDEAQGAQRTAMTAATNARAAETAAQEAKQAAEAVNQHFWDDTRGAHVTEATQEDYLDEPSGFQNLMTSLGNIFTKAVNGVERILRSDTASGMVVYDGECAPDAQDLEDHAVAAFTKDGAQIGRKGNAHVEMDFNSFKMADKNGNEFFVADDLRDETGAATITETFAGNGTTKDFTVMLVPDAYVSATDSSHEGAAYTTSYRVVRFEVAPDDGATVTIVYKTSSSHAKAYTLGMRMPRSLVGPMSVAEGVYTTASGIESHAEGDRTIASGNYSHAEGNATTASDQYSHAEGWSTIASGRASHAEGVGTTARNQYSHAEGNSTAALGDCSHAEGDHTIASGYGSHAEGDHTTAGVNSHAEGSYTTASGSSSHAEGRDTTVSGDRSHAEGDHTIASSDRQHVEGKYNVADTNNQYAHIIGNGTNDNNRSNAHTVDWNGNAWYAGDVEADGGLIAGGDVSATDITAAGDVSDATGSLDKVRQDSKDASNITSGTLSISRGGTGASTAATAWTNLGGGSIGKKNSLAASDIPNHSTDKLTSGTLPIGRGGTNATTASGARTQLEIAPTSLWSGNSNGNITLSQSAANFTRITIYYRDNDNQYGSVDVYSPNGKLVLLFSTWEGRYNKMRSVNISGTSITTNRAYQTDAMGSGSEATNLIYITRVLGWKY